MLLCMQPRGHIPHLLQHLRRPLDADGAAKGEHPREERRGGRHIHADPEMVGVHHLRGHILPEVVYDAPHGAVFTQQRHPLGRVVVHAKDLPDITGWVKERVCYVRGVGFLDGRHAVHPELGQFPVLSRPAHGVVEVPVPDEGVRAEAIAVPLMFQDLFLFRRVLEILEGDGPLFVDRRLDGVDGVVHGLVVRLGRAVHVDGAVQERGVVPACEVAQLLDEGGAFLLRDEVGGLNGVHQQFQFRQLQQRGADKVTVLRAFDADDVQAEVHEQLDITVNILPVGLGAMCLPKAENIRASCIVVLICLLQEKL